MVVSLRVLLALCLCLMLGACSQTQQRGEIIAHRGASWYLPEHTLEAYALAYGLDADYIEPDLVLSREGVPICAHDLRMESVCNVKEVFPDRAREDGRWYWIDFDLSEIKQLERYARKEAPTIGYTLCTLEEVLVMVDRMNKKTGRVVGVYPELKKPEFHTQEGYDFAGVVTKMLAEYGYTSRDDAVIIQSFSLETLEGIRKSGSDLRLAWAGQKSPPTNEVLDRASQSIDVLILNRNLVENDDQSTHELIARARKFGFTIHSATFDSESEAARRFLTKHKIDGVFCNDPVVWIDDD